MNGKKSFSPGGRCALYIPRKELEKLVDYRNDLEENNDKLIELLKKEKSLNKTLYGKIMEKNSIINNKEKSIEEIKSENKELKKQNQIYKEIYRKNKPDWHVNIDNAWKINQETDKLEQYPIPKNFNVDNVKNLIISDDIKWTSFKYEDDENKNRTYNIPRQLAEQLEIIDSFDNNNKQEKINLKQIKDKKFIIKFLESRSINTNQGYWKETIDFLIWFRGSKFKTSEFYMDCKSGNRETARLYLNKLIEFGLIKRVKKGLYEVLFNFD